MVLVGHGVRYRAGVETYMLLIIGGFNREPQVHGSCVSLLETATPIGR